MRKLKVAISHLLLILLMPALSFSSSMAIDNGASWLSTVQNPDGSWGNNTDRAILDTSSVIDTLRYLDKSGPAYLAGINWLNTQAPLTADFLSRKIISLHMAGIDVTADVTALVNSRRADGGWGGDADATSMANDTALALQALKAVNYSDQSVINSALYNLTSTQNSDGGFGFCSSASVGCSDGSSNVYMTALVSSTLQQFPQTTATATAINKATTYLIAHQNIDGGFGSSPSTVYETSLAIIALINGNTGQAQDLPLQEAIQNAINYIETTQFPNGSWNDDPYSTALALRALANVKPNLTITTTDIAFSNPIPKTGDTITITATVHNTGPAQAPSTAPSTSSGQGSGQDGITVQFYDDNPNSDEIFIDNNTVVSGKDL